MGAIAVVLILVLYVLILFAGRYFKSYFDEKGENLATKEDFKELKAQTAELRTATKEIEAKIDDQVWDRQRRWELKRDGLLEAARCIADYNAALVRLDSVLKVKAQNVNSSDKVKSYLINEQTESTRALNDADLAFGRAKLVITVIGSEQVRRAFTTTNAVLHEVSERILTDGAVDQYSTNTERIQKTLSDLTVAIRQELLSPQSSGSSPTPNPDDTLNRRQLLE